MKVLPLLFFLFLTLQARENPFKPLFTKPKAPKTPIPLLHISSTKPIKIPKAPMISKPLYKSMPIIKKTLPPIATTIPLAPTIDHSAIMIVQKPKPIKRAVKKRQGYKTLYKNYFLKIQTNYKSFKIITKDKTCKVKRFTNPNRIALDFDKLQYFHTKNITLNRAFAKKIKLGTHHDFYRITVELNKYKHYKLAPKPYGYLFTLY